MASLRVGSVAPGHFFGKCTKTDKLMGVKLLDGCQAFKPDNSKDNGMFYLGCGCHCFCHKVEKFEQLAINLDPDTQPHPSGSGEYLVRKYRKYSDEDRSKMLAMARELQWKMPGRNKEAKARLEDFCIQMDIKYQTFKSWLHMAKRNPTIHLADF